MEDQIELGNNGDEIINYCEDECEDIPCCDDCGSALELTEIAPRSPEELSCLDLRCSQCNLI